MKEKKTYEEPNAEIVRFGSQDVITTSGGGVTSPEFDKHENDFFEPLWMD